MIYQLRVFPDEILKQRPNLIVSDYKNDHDLKSFVRNLTETMNSFKAAGLAAVQVGVPYNLFVLNTDKERVCINPIIISTEGSDYSKEGCLSFPGSFMQVSRPAVAKVSYFDIDGNQVEETLTGFTARAFLHEYDHCHGILMTDRLNKFAAESLIKKSRKYRQMLTT